MQHPIVPGNRLIRHRSILLFAIPALLVLFILNCQKEESTAPQGTEVENEIVGRIFVRGGGPAVGARVRLFPVSYSPFQAAPKQGNVRSTPYFSAFTDANGKYVLDSLPHGEYNILAEQDSTRSYRDSVGISSNSLTLPSDTLEPTGSMSGVVELQPNHDPGTAIVEILGTSTFVNVGRDGRFLLPDLAGGHYSIKVSTSLSNYTPLFTGFALATGQQDSLSNTLKPHYTGIPVVTGLRLDAYDTLRGIVNLSWKPSDYANLLGYEIFRDTTKAIALSQTPINRTRVEDTVFSDTLDFSHTPAMTSMDLEYRVRIRDLENNFGPLFEFVKVHAAAPYLAKTDIRTSQSGGRNDSASINESIHMIANFSNPTRQLSRLKWSVDSQVVRTVSLNGREGSDTLDTAFATPKDRKIAVEIEDLPGAKATAFRTMHIVAIPPTVFAGPDSTVSIGDSLSLKGSAQSRFGNIVKWEWDIGGTGVFQAYPGGASARVALPDSAIDDYPITLRVQDEYGLVASQTRHLRVGLTSILPSPPPLGNAKLIALNGNIYAVNGGTKNVYAYDPIAQRWSTKASRLASRVRFGIAVHRSKLFLLGDTLNYSTSKGDDAVEAYDPIADTWAIKGSLPHKEMIQSVVDVQGRLSVLSVAYPDANGNTYSPDSAQLYDDDQDKWSTVPFPDGPAVEAYPKGDSILVVFNDNQKIYVSTFSKDLIRLSGTYAIPFGCANGVRVAQSGAKLYLLTNASCSAPQATNFYEIDLENRTVRSLPSLELNASLFSATVLDGTIYLLEEDPYQGISKRFFEYKIR